MVVSCNKPDGVDFAALHASIAALTASPETTEALQHITHEMHAIVTSLATRDSALRLQEARVASQLELLSKLPSPCGHTASRHQQQSTTTSERAKVVTLNVGGTLFTTARETLLRTRGSYFDAMLSSDHWLPNEKGEYFLDLDPSTFPRIMKLLRTGFLPLDGLSEADEAELREMLDYLQIECPQPTPSAPPAAPLHNVYWDPRQCSVFLKLRERDTIVRQTTTGWSNVLATTLEKTFVVRVRLGAKIEVGFSTLKTFSPHIHRYGSAPRGYYFNCETYDVYSQLTKRVPSGLDPSTPTGIAVLLLQHDRDRRCIQFSINGTALAMTLRVEAGDVGALFPIARISSAGAEVELLPFQVPF
ncbi:hypothetical protein SDRG_05000 [Saprolegnia diclina VS20]|uniref:BTB domain-containing protein n=1 Tax=Saprolegnia diclina (strain VS20) TaxID=1156394 RepID=T0QRQ4_SAPDV|nr:hypothetical protein SDRG_05000 [Saprolegnia diclina VS20]EQC37396.1 hypothetical protein SDRG_05000 [Saprolegnia diclina VS20]|eukprot:XP_008608916.1 hypothetical protein SDRG_05000 [Saprolegnia diclina VS20]